MDDVTKNDTDMRIEWVEPAATILDVGETAGFPGRGRDGGRAIDCTLS